MKDTYIAILDGGLDRYFVFGYKEYNIAALVFINFNDEEAKKEIYEWSWLDRAEWVGLIPCRTYKGWKIEDVKEFEELLKGKDENLIFV